MTGFVHLRLHSDYSLRDGLVRVDALPACVVERNMPAVALTDHSNLFALIKFYKACLQAGIKPIAGVDLQLADADGNELGLMTLLVQNRVGYRNLIQLVSRAWREGRRLDRVFVRPEWVAEAADGLLALSGGREGEIGRALLSGRESQASERLVWWQRHFPDRFYLELQRTGRENEEDYLHAAVGLAQREGCPVVATNDVRFLNSQEFDAHEARVCIAESQILNDPKRPRLYSPQQYLRSPQEMAELFADIPEALANSVEIARRCTLEIPLGKYVLPAYPAPAGESEVEHCRRMAREGLQKRLQALNALPRQDDPLPQSVYEERLDFELNVIEQMGFCGYFLIVMEFIAWAKNNGVPVGPGRGSGAGSLVAYSLGITDLDPLAYDLLFERFLNPERVSMPDFDVDFCVEGRDRVIDHVADLYGREAVSQIITFGTMAARAVVRDVGRVQGKPYGVGDRIARLIPGTPGMTLERALQEEPALKEAEETSDEVAEVLEMAFELEGLSRNVGTHAGGVVIAPGALTDHVPLYCDADGNLISQFDKDDVEAAGLVKFDFLGLRNLTIIDWTVKMVNARRQSGEALLDIQTLPLNDQPTYGLLTRGDTTAVFQLESSGMKQLIKRLEPDRFEDVIALVALFRPGPLQSGMVDDFVNRKLGKQQVIYPHPLLEPILNPTYGVIVYQEQVMQIAQVMAGYTLGGADMLRRAMGKKKPEEMAQQRAIFEEGAARKGIDARLATSIFDLMEKFAEYGFNKSHSAAYALLAYQTAWLKAHHTAEYMAATLSSVMDHTDKLAGLIEECRFLDGSEHYPEIKVLPPDVNRSESRFSVDDEGRIVYGLGAVKGLGQGPIEALLTAREQGPFTDLYDFCARVDAQKINRKALEALIFSGSFDSLGVPRHVLAASLEEALRAAEQQTQNQSLGMEDLFGEAVVAEDGPVVDVYARFRAAPAWDEAQRLKLEKQTLGLYLSGHPLNAYKAELGRLTSARIADVSPSREPVRIAGLVVAVRTRSLKSGDTGAFVTLDDNNQRIEANVFSEAFTRYREKLKEDQLIFVTGEVAEDRFNGGLKIIVREVQTLDEARVANKARLQLRVDHDVVSSTVVVNRLSQLLEPAMGETGCPVAIEYRGEQVAACLHLEGRHRFWPSDDRLRELRGLLGDGAVKLQY